MLFDCLGLAVGLWASVAATWKPDGRYTLGYSRVETLSGFANGECAAFLIPLKLNTGQAAFSSSSLYSSYSKPSKECMPQKQSEEASLTREQCGPSRDGDKPAASRFLHRTSYKSLGHVRDRRSPTSSTQPWSFSYCGGE